MRFGIYIIFLPLLWSCSFADKISQNLDSRDTGQDSSKNVEEAFHSDIKSNVVNIGTSFSESEVRVLNQLSERRNKILQDYTALKNKEAALKAVEHNIEKKIRELEILREKVEKECLLLKSKDDEKVKSLVKIYENMNPRRAAQIFDEIELETLIQIICSMKEIKVSAILANMEISKAKELSVALTKRSTNNTFKMPYE